MAPLKQSSLKLGSLLTVRMRTNSRKVFSSSFSSLAAGPAPPPAPLEGGFASQILLTAWLALLLGGSAPAAQLEQVCTSQTFCRPQHVTSQTALPPRRHKASASPPELARLVSTTCQEAEQTTSCARQCVGRQKEPLLKTCVCHQFSRTRYLKLTCTGLTLARSIYRQPFCLLAQLPASVKCLS